MEKELTNEEIERRAGDMARRVMATPPQPRTKPKPAAKTPDDAAKPGKRAPTASAS